MCVYSQLDRRLGSTLAYNTRDRAMLFYRKTNCIIKAFVAIDAIYQQLKQLNDPRLNFPLFNISQKNSNISKFAPT